MLLVLVHVLVLVVVYALQVQLVEALLLQKQLPTCLKSGD